MNVKIRIHTRSTKCQYSPATSTRFAFAGVLFLGMQAFEWHHLLGERGMSIKVDLFDATFFILTGFHGCHVFGGVVYNSVLLIRGMTGKLTPAKANLVEVAGLYWHFVDLVWILIFTFIYLI